MQAPAFAIHLRKLHPAGFRDPQTVPRQEQDQAAVAGFVPCLFDGGPQPVHFQAGEVFAFIHAGFSVGAEIGLEFVRTLYVLSKYYETEHYEGQS